MEPFEKLRSIVATRTRRIVIWCGAGLSVPAGLPTWTLLQRRLEAQLAQKLATLDLAEAQREVKLKAIRQETNPWVAFQRLHAELGATSFREGVREAFVRAATVEVPKAYNAMWKLGPAGVINLNIDRLATKAFVESQGSGLIEFKGKEIGPYAYALNSPRPFLCNLHGIEEDYESWIFTIQSLKGLADGAAYGQFINAVFASSTVLFLGITADDVAVGGHLERLSEFGIQTQAHYWITDRRDAATDAWAERNNILAIRYQPSSSQHPELEKMLLELASYVQPEDEPSPPVSLNIDLGDVHLESPGELIAKSPEHIREVLNSRAAQLLKSADEDSFDRYEQFSKQYDRAIHAAWYTSTESGENEFLGYKLVEEVARGAFGIVFRAIGRHGEEVAIKLLHAEIRKNRELLHAFRRGVRSMRILEDRGVAGVVKYLAASEIPATLIMEWMDGPNLVQAVQSGGFNEWDQILDVALQLVEVIAAGHALPERVLHRDIRPSNMIIQGYWEAEPLSVKVLDFDLSWHRGSVEKSVIFGSALSGYLAPEQLVQRPGVSTQHAAVDSYGLGMTFFFMISGRNPGPNEHAGAAWSETLQLVAQKPRGESWRSLPRRMARLIDFATQDRQERRWDVLQIKSEVARLRLANTDPYSARSAELWAEELACRAGLQPYQWDDRNFSVVKNFQTGLEIVLRGDENGQEVVLEMTRVATESENRSKLRDAIGRARENVVAALKSGGWDVGTDVGRGLLKVRAHVKTVRLAEKPEAFIAALRKAQDRMVFT